MNSKKLPETFQNPSKPFKTHQSRYVPGLFEALSTPFSINFFPVHRSDALEVLLRRAVADHGDMFRHVRPAAGPLPGAGRAADGMSLTVIERRWNGDGSR